jgi:hypothetical protein
MPFSHAWNTLNPGVRMHLFINLAPGHIMFQRIGRGLKARPMVFKNINDTSQVALFVVINLCNDVGSSKRIDHHTRMWFLVLPQCKIKLQSVT